MINNLLTTKLLIPSLSSELIKRPLVCKRLQSGLESGKRLILISAPPGYGKTTLVSEWIYQYHLKAVWISLDEGDNDLIRFITYLAAGLSHFLPEIFEVLKPYLQATQARDKEALLNFLINAFTKLPKNTLLVLDDYHLIHQKNVHDSLEYLLQHLGDQVHVVIISRSDPPFSLARLRGRGQICEIRQNDLRFTNDEAAILLSKLLQENLREEDISVLCRRTEGWAAGLQMAAVSLQGERDKSDFIRSFGGSHRFILDYLLEEVLDNQLEDTKQFLLKTSILTRFNASLCDFLFDTRINYAEVIRELEQANLFIQPLDEKREWYRYHRLFSDLLLKTLSRTYPEQISELNWRASIWFEGRGELEEALGYSLETNDTQRSLLLLEKIVDDVFARGETYLFLTWAKRIPFEELKKNPKLLFQFIWAMFWNGSSRENIYSYLDMDWPDKVYEAKALALKAAIASLDGDFQQALELFSISIKNLPEDDWFFQNLVQIIHAKVLYSAADSIEGIKKLEEAASWSLSKGNTFTTVLILCNLGELWQKQLKLDKAEAYFSQALEISTDDHGNISPMAGAALAGLGDIYLEQNRLDDSEENLLQAVRIAGDWSSFVVFDALLGLVLLKQAKGEYEAARQFLLRARNLAIEIKITQMDDRLVDLLEARLNIWQGNLAAARNWATLQGLIDLRNLDAFSTKDGIQSRLKKYEIPTLARLYLAENRLDDCLIVLELLERESRRVDRPYLLLEALILKSLVFFSLQQYEKAYTVLTEGMKIAASQNVRRLFLNEGEKMGFFLQEYLHQGFDKSQDQFVEILLEDFGLIQNVHSNVDLDQTILVEPLSERELEVLTLLPSQLSSTELASEMQVSVNTLRTHLKNIYQKLGVHSRHAAIEKARSLKLI